MGTRSLWWRHAPDAVALHRSPVHLMGRRGLAHCLRYSGSAARGKSDRPHRRRRRHEVRGLEAAGRRIRQAVWRRNAEREDKRIMKDSSKSSKKELPEKQREELLRTLQARFQANMTRHKGLVWSEVEDKLEANAEKIWSLNEMERTGGEPDVVGHDKK